MHAEIQLGQRRLHAAQQHRPRGVQHHATPAALEQLEPELLFQAPYLLAHSAVREMQHVGGGAQILQLGDGAKGGKGVEWQARHAGKHT